MAHICERATINERKSKVKTALSQLWDCECPSLNLGKTQAGENLRAMRGFMLQRDVDLSPKRNRVKKFPLADLVIYCAPLSFNSWTISV
jgi:hypothetical protein